MVQLTADNSTFPATIVIGDMATVSVCMMMIQMMAIFRFYYCIAIALQTFLSGEWIVKKCFTTNYPVEKHQTLLMFRCGWFLTVFLSII